MSEETLEENVNEESEASTEEYSPAEEKATQGGWKPQEDYEGPEEDWVTAQEFNRRGELFDTIHGLKSKAKNQDAVIADLVEHNRKKDEAAVDDVIGRLKQAKTDALDEDDNARVVEIDDQIQDLKESKRAVKEASSASQKEQANNSPEYLQWVQSNPWFNNNPELNEEAQVTGMLFAKRNPGANMTAILEHVTTEVKRRNPDMFETKRRRSNVSGGKGGPKGGSKSRFSSADLNQEQRDICNRFVRQKVMTEDEYVKQLADMGELG